MVTDIPKMTPAELNAAVAEEVMGIDLDGTKPDLPIRGIGCQLYATDISADYEVLDYIRQHWPDEKPGELWEAFCENLWELSVLRKRIGWNLVFDSHGLYQPGDYARAALKAVRQERKCDD